MKTDSQPDGNFFRGLFIALAISMLFWAALILVIK